VPRFLSSDWVEAFNDALRDADLISAEVPSSMIAAGGRYRIAQVVLDPPPGLAPDPPPGSEGASPEGDGTGARIRTVLVVDGGRVHLALDPALGGDGGAEADVTVMLSYTDAADLSRGELDPIGVLGTGRIRIRGDLSVLVAGQSLLAAAAARLAALHAVTTY